MPVAIDVPIILGSLRRHEKRCTLRLIPRAVYAQPRACSYIIRIFQMNGKFYHLFGVFGAICRGQLQIKWDGGVGHRVFRKELSRDNPVSPNHSPHKSQASTYNFSIKQSHFGLLDQSSPCLSSNYVWMPFRRPLSVSHQHWTDGCTLASHYHLEEQTGGHNHHPCRYRSRDHWNVFDAVIRLLVTG